MSMAGRGDENKKARTQKLAEGICSFLSSLANAETAKIFVRSLAKYKRNLMKIFHLPPVTSPLSFLPLNHLLYNLACFSTSICSQPFRSHRGKASTLFSPFLALSDIPGQIVGIINSDCRFLSTVNFSFIRFGVCCCCLLGKCYIYFLVEDSMKLKVFQIIFYDDYSFSLSLAHSRSR